MFGLGSILSGAQTTMHDWRMFVQLLRTLRNWALVIALITVGWTAWHIWKTQPQQIKAALFHIRAETIGQLQPGDTIWHFTDANGKPGTITIDAVTGNPAFKASYDMIIDRLIMASLYGIGGAIGVILLLVIIFRLRGVHMQRTTWLRGASIAAPAKLNRITTRTYRWIRWLPLPVRRSPRFALAGITWPQGGEMRHTMIVGTTGSGKTVAMSQLLDQIRASGGKAIIYDKMGSYIPHFYRPGRDIILNPLDERSHDWDLFAEVRHEQDFDMIAAALIPAFKDTADPFWTTAARQIFASGAAALWKAGNANLPALIDMLLRTNLKELASAMEGMVEQAIIDPDNNKTALSVRAILTTAIKPLSYLPPPRWPFSVRNWVESEEDSFLFLSSDAISHERRKALIATQLEIATAAMLSGSKHPDRRIWFIIDELPTLEQIPSLTSGLRESRQYGGCFVIGTQVVSELREIYGRNEAETISGNCNTRLILATPDMATAEWCASGLGRIQAEHTLEGRSFGSSEVRDGVNISKREDIKPIVLPSEIMELKPLNGYIRVGGGFPVAKIRLTTRDRPIIAEHLVPADQIDPKTGEVYETDRMMANVTDASSGLDQTGVIATEVPDHDVNAHGEWSGTMMPSGPPPTDVSVTTGQAADNTDWPDAGTPTGPVPDWMAQIPPATSDRQRTGGKSQNKTNHQMGFFDENHGGVDTSGSSDSVDRVGVPDANHAMQDAMTNNVMDTAFDPDVPDDVKVTDSTVSEAPMTKPDTTSRQDASADTGHMAQDNINDQQGKADTAEPANMTDPEPANNADASADTVHMAQDNINDQQGKADTAESANMTDPEPTNNADAATDAVTGQKQTSTSKSSNKTSPKGDQARKSSTRKTKTDTKPTFRNPDHQTAAEFQAPSPDQATNNSIRKSETTKAGVAHGSNEDM